MTIEAASFRRGDVILAPLPLVTDPTERKVRPAVVIQNDTGNRFSPNLIVASISSQVPRRTYPTNLIVRYDSAAAAGSGLDRDSVVQTELIVTVPKVAVVRRLGHFGDSTMRAVDECLMVSLALD